MTSRGDVEKALYDLLRADPALGALVGARIYRNQAPQNVEHPYVLYSLHGSTTSRTWTQRSTYTVSYFVRGIDRANRTTPDATVAGVVEIAARIDELLGEKALSLAGTTAGNAISKAVDVSEQGEFGDASFFTEGGVYEVTVTA